MLANEKVDEAWEEAKPNFPPQPETIFIIPINSLLWHGLNLSKNGFIIELVIKSDMRIATIQIVIFINSFLFLNLYSMKIINK